MDTGIASIVIALILGGIITSVIYGYVPRKKIIELIRTKNELLQVYKDVIQLLEVEQQILEEAEVSKLKARKNRVISTRCEPTRIKKRIRELESQMQNNGTI